MNWEKAYSVIKSWKVFLLTVLLVVLAILYLRYAKPVKPYTPEPGLLTAGEIPRAVEKVIEKIRIVKVPGPERIVYLDKPGLAAALKMPELKSLTDNVLSVATVKPHTGPTTAIATLSPTGEGGILLRQEPQPFWDLKREFRMQGRYLLVGTNVAELDILANPLRIGPVEVVGGAGVELNRDTSALKGRAYVGFEYRF